MPISTPAEIQAKLDEIETQMEALRAKRSKLRRMKKISEQYHSPEVPLDDQPGDAE